MRTIVVVLAIALGWALVAGTVVYAQTDELPIGTFSLQLLLGTVAGWGGGELGKLLPFRGGSYWTGTLSAALGAGVGGLMLGHKGDWLFAYAGSLAGWTAAGFFATGLFNPNSRIVVPYIGVALSGRDVIHWATMMAAAFFATVSFNL